MEETSLVETLLLARLWVARLGEADVCRWWRTEGLLGEDGAFVGRRLLPRTHAAARARIAFAVARHACDERHPDRRAYHLFRLSPETEDRLEALLVSLLDSAGWWEGVMSRIERVQGGDEPGDVLVSAGVVGSPELEAARQAQLGPEERSLAVEPGASPVETVRRLAAGFARSRAGALVVPWVREAP